MDGKKTTLIPRLWSIPRLWGLHIRVHHLSAILVSKPFLDELTHCHTGHLHSFRTPPGVVPKSYAIGSSGCAGYRRRDSIGLKDFERSVKEDKQGVAP